MVSDRVETLFISFTLQWRNQKCVKMKSESEWNKVERERNIDIIKLKFMEKLLEF